MAKRISSIGLLIIGFISGAAVTGVSATMLGSAVFSDVKSGAYYDQAVGELSSVGIINGYDDGRFGPNDFVTRGQVAVLMKRLRDDLLLNLNPEPTAQRKTSDLAASVADGAERAEESVESEEVSSSAEVAEDRGGSDVEERENVPETKVASSVSNASSVSTHKANEAGLIRFTIDKYNVDEDEGSAMISVVRTGGKKGAATVDYTISDGTAKAVDDYELVTGTIRFSDNETSAVFAIQINDDEFEEGNEVLTLSLGKPTGGAELTTPNIATLTIKDNEEPTTAGVDTLSFGAMAYDAAENGGSITIKVLRSGQAAGEARIDYTTNNGSATNSNYTPVSGTLTFAAGETQRTFNVSVIDNGIINGNKTVNLVLSNPTGAVLGGSTAVLTITDDEVGSFGSGSVKFTRATYSAPERDGRAVIEISRIGGTKGTVSVGYKTDGGTAIAPADYEVTSGTITFESGESKKFFEVKLIHDDQNDSGERINLKLQNPVGTVLTSPSEATLTVE